MCKIEMTYLCQPPRKYTFEQPKLKKYVESNCSGKTLNLFAGKTLLNIKETRVDIDTEVIADYHMDALEYIKYAITKNIKFDTIILDPPYNLRKAREKYKGKYIGSFTKIKNIISEILNESGKIIILGYDTVGMSKSRGFSKIAICVICHGGDHNDTLCVIEEKI